MRITGSKMILNQEDNKRRNQRSDVKKNNPPLRIVDDKENNQLICYIDKNFLKNNDSFDIQKLLSQISNPLFLNKNKIFENSVNNSEKNKKKFIRKIGIFMDGRSHYTGGRYSILHQVAMLSNYADVVIYSDIDMNNILKNFKSYFVEGRILFNIGFPDGNFDNLDLVIGLPFYSGKYANEFCIKNNLPLVSVVFETPNYINEEIESEYGTEEYWKGYKEVLSNSTAIICPSKLSLTKTLEWIRKDFDSSSSVVYPCANQRIKAKDVDIKGFDGKRKIVLSLTRLTDFKNPLRVIKKIRNKSKFHFVIIGNLKGTFENELLSLQKKGYKITHSPGVSDKMKFSLIEKSHIIMHPSEFEGFGMPPLEALVCNKPVIAFDIPVFREIYSEKGLNLIPKGEYETFANVFDSLARGNLKLDELKTDQNIRAILLEKYHYRNCIKSLLKALSIPSITAGIIVYNGEDYIAESIKSIYFKVSKIVIVEGAVRGYASKSDSTDKTIEILRNFPDPMNKIEIVRKKGFWKDKIQMQNEIAKRVDTDFYLKLDHDEIWTDELLAKSMNEFLFDPELMILKVPFTHFWLSMSRIAKDSGGKWTACQPRLWRWKEGFRHEKSFNYFQDSKTDFRKVQSPFFKEKVLEDNFGIFHFGYVKPKDQLLQKIKYYKNRGIERYVVDTVSEWSEGKPTQPTQKVRSWSEKFKGNISFLSNHKYFKRDFANE